MHRHIVIGLPALVLLVFLAAPSEAAAIAVPVSSTFDSDVDGWTGDNVGEFSFGAPGGNPDGYLRFDDLFSLGGFAIAPSKFLGDWSALDGSGAIRYDQRVISAGSHTGSVFRRILLSGPGGSAEWQGPFPCGGQFCTTPWETFFALLDESVWTVTSGTWAALLADVTDFRISADQFITMNPTPDAEGLDNIQLEQTSGGLLVRVVYGAETIVQGPLSFGLSTPPESFNATILLSGFSVKENVVAGLGDVAVFSLHFGDGLWTDLTSFSLVTDAAGEVTTLSYATTAIDTPAVVAGVILNSSFSATIEGTHIASGQDFEYDYADSAQTLLVVPAPAVPGLPAGGLGVLALLVAGCGLVTLRRSAAQC